MMRLATKAGSANPRAVQRPGSPQLTPVVTCHQEWSGRSPLSEALTEARNCPSKSDQQILVKEVPIDAHAIHELGHVCTLPGRAPTLKTRVGAQEDKAGARSS